MRPEGQTGFVSLVGAGPGRLEYLTLGALRRVERADMIFHDALLDPELLAQARPGAEVVNVGKRAACARAAKQDTILHLMVEAARKGAYVVRLKAGDPFVLGRGGEEGLYLRQQGVSFEVVPGLSSALLAPQVAGIPVTHRGLTTGFLTVSGHHLDGFRDLVLGLTPMSVTLVVLMGFRNRDALRDCLLELGWRSDLPLALIAGAGQAPQRVGRSTLGRLGLESEFDPQGAPVTMVIGWTAGLEIASDLETPTGARNARSAAAV
ncbi:MAG: uroporphyrinogen-III C-methyltransferase [Myxococcota bacterium]